MAGMLTKPKMKPQVAPFFSPSCPATKKPKAPIASVVPAMKITAFRNNTMKKFFQFMILCSEIIGW